MAPASYYFRFYLARAMVHAGLGDEYIAQLDPWRRMLKMGLSTWAEQPEPTRSDSHAWSAHPTLDLLTIVAGIAPGAPGFATVRITPHLGSLQHASVTMPTPKGLVDVQYERQGKGFKATVTLPEGLPGELAWHDQTMKTARGETGTALTVSSNLQADKSGMQRCHPGASIQGAISTGASIQGAISTGAQHSRLSSQPERSIQGCHLNRSPAFKVVISTEAQHSRL